jgi:hypothetical protein
MEAARIPAGILDKMEAARIPAGILDKMKAARIPQVKFHLFADTYLVIAVYRHNPPKHFQAVGAESSAQHSLWR